MSERPHDGGRGRRVVVERAGPVTVVRLDRPEVRNALDVATGEALVAAFGEAAADDAVRAVVLTGTGDRAFCAGMDLKAFSSSGSQRSPLTEFLRGGAYPKPLVAAVNGPAVGGGFELALACDLIVAADHAWFALPEVARGLFAAGGGTVVLPRRVPPSIALELALTGDRLPAERALALGLVNRVVPGEELRDAALALAGAVAANGPLGVRATKALIWSVVRGDESDAWAAVDARRDEVFTSDEAAEGATAFLERRAPSWRPSDTNVAS